MKLVMMMVVLMMATSITSKAKTATADMIHHGKGAGSANYHGSSR